jgi:hypothetical protein
MLNHRVKLTDTELLVCKSRLEDLGVLLELLVVDGQALGWGRIEKFAGWRLAEGLGRGVKLA